MGKFGVYKQLYKNGAEIIKYGKLIKSYNPALEYDPQNMEVIILHECDTMHDAQRAYAHHIFNKPVMVEGPLGARVYRSAADAARATGVHEQSVRACVDGRKGYQRPRGFTFMAYPKELVSGPSDFNDPAADFAALPPPPPRQVGRRRFATSDPTPHRAEVERRAQDRRADEAAAMLDPGRLKT